MKTLLYSYIIGISLSCISCNDILQEDPKGQIVPSTFMSTQEELDMSVYALYRKVCELQGNTNPLISAWQGDDITTNPGSNKVDYFQVDAFYPSDVNKGVSPSWNTAYNVIKAANYILLNAERVPTTKEEINIATGQALFWRAVSYFWLVRRFGPIPLTLDNNVDDNRPLADEGTVYEQIEHDLTECLSLLPINYTTEPRKANGINVYITKQAVQATMAAVYMAMAGWPLNKTEYYAKAAEQAKAVIDGVKSGEYEFILEPEFKNVYAPSHNYTLETVLGINYSEVFTWDEDSQFSASNLFESLGGWGDAWGEINFWKEYPSGPRKDAIYNVKILDNNGRDGETELLDWWDERIPEQHPMMRVFTVGIGNTDYNYTQPAATNGTNNHRHRLIRYAEVLLWYAESQARAEGKPNELAYECINKIRDRAGLDPLPEGMNGEDFAEAAYKEHGWEIAGYWPALVTRRDDQMRLERLEEYFNKRKENHEIEVAPGIFRHETEIPANVVWQGKKSIYLPYPATDTQLNPNLKR